MLLDCFVQAEKWAFGCSRGRVEVTKGGPHSSPLLISTVIHSAGGQYNSLICPVSMRPERESRKLVWPR
jgi:hypothetical protein